MDADIEKKSPACTIIELVGFPIECFGAYAGNPFSVCYGKALATASPA